MKNTLEKIFINWEKYPANLAEAALRANGIENIAIDSQSFSITK